MSLYGYSVTHKICIPVVIIDYYCILCNLPKLDIWSGSSHSIQITCDFTRVNIVYM